MIKRYRMLAALAVLAVGPAFAAERAPTILPSHDVAIQYRVSGRGAQHMRELHVRFTAAQRLLRVETEDRGRGYVVVDPARRSARLVMPGLGQFIDLPLARDRRAALLLGDGVQFGRRGTARVAGRGCTLWDARTGADSATLCLTADGILLRAQGHSGDMAGSVLEAFQVQNTPQPPALFQLPAQARALNLPDMLRQFLPQAR